MDSWSTVEEAALMAENGTLYRQTDYYIGQRRRKQGLYLEWKCRRNYGVIYTY
jgi:hypothetical protein